MSIALDAALSGLSVAQQQINTISANIANASTPGYTDKVLPQTTQIINGQAVGVTSEALTRVVNQTLINDVNQQMSVSGYASVQQSYFSQIQNFQGSPTGGTSLTDQITSLDNTFTQLSQSPNDPTLQSQVLTTAQQTTSQINNFSNLLTGMRSQTESDISANVKTVNNDLNMIAQLNVQITSLDSQGQSTADLKDKRDAAISDVSKYIQISTSTNGNTVSVLTTSGQILANDAAQTLYFTPSNMLPTSYYPGGGLSGITIGSPTGTDIAAQGNLGGQIGGLLNLRDQTLQQYGAQLDEFSQKLASRFQAEGLTLFTDANGNVPANVPAPGAVGYVGFSTLIQVNPAIIANPALIQQGTTGTPQPADSSEVINRITQYAFGNFQSQQATGAVNISDASQPLDNLFSPPLTTNNSVTGTVNLATYADFTTLPGDTKVLPDSFNLTLGALPPQVITVNPTDTAASLVTQINTAFGSTVASVNTQGQLALNYNGDITLSDNGDVLPALGLTAGTTPMPALSFNVQVGTNPPVAISIAATDTSTDLLTKLNAVSGLTASLDPVTGFLVMTPTNGGSLGAIDATGGPLSALGVAITNVPFTPFRQNNLGPNGTISTGLLANSTLQDYISSSVSVQSEAANLNQTQSTQETSYLNTLQNQNSNLSGVSIDQEMTRLIQVQSAYTAAAKMITATQTLFQDLIAAFPN
jgi:flagellar hook-associated protein 1 FlgK